MVGIGRRGARREREKREASAPARTVPPAANLSLFSFFISPFFPSFRRCVVHAKQTYGCPITGLAAVCPSYKLKSVPKGLEKAGIEKRAYGPAVFAFLPVNASSFGSAAVSTSPALASYTGGDNEKGMRFHETAPTYLRFAPSAELRAVGRAYVASRFLDVAEAADAPPPTSNADIRVCKARPTEVYVTNWTSASPLPGPPTAATVLAHLHRLASHLKAEDARFCARDAWLMSYSPDSMVTGRKYFEVSVDAGRCRSEAEEKKEGVCAKAGREEAGREAAASHLLRLGAV